MLRPLTLLLATILALTLLGSATAEGEPNTEPVAGAYRVLANSTISCSSAWPSTTLGCFWERPVLVVGNIEVAVGLDAQAVLTGSLADAHLAPYLIVAAYLDSWSAWTEVRLPELAGVKPLGSADWLRLGFTIRIPP